MMIKKIILNLAIVAACVYVLDFAVGNILMSYFFKQTSGPHYRATHAIETNESEILVFGSSRANHHFVPEVIEASLGMSSYNAGRDGHGILYHNALLKTILKRYKPKVIILDYAGGFEKSASEYDRLSVLLPYYKSHKQEIKSTIDLKSPYESIKLLSKIYPFNSELFAVALGNSEIGKTRNQDNKGYVGLHKEWQAEADSVEVFSTTLTPFSLYKEIDTTQLAAFREFISTAKKSGIKVFVTISPIFVKSKINQEAAICKKICAEENVPFLDYSKKPFFLKDKTLFQDIVHLNHKGAVVFSKMICQEIKEGTSL